VRAPQETKKQCFEALFFGLESNTAFLSFYGAQRSDVFVIPNTKTNELGEKVLNERSEFRNLTPQSYEPDA
jgi:hypothetical protein